MKFLITMISLVFLFGCANEEDILELEIIDGHMEVKDFHGEFYYWLVSNYVEYSINEREITKDLIDNCIYKSELPTTLKGRGF